jgi:hypothetical protein
MKYESSFSHHATSLAEQFRLREWFEIRLSPRTRVTDRANTWQTQRIVLFFVDSLCCRMFVCFPVLFSIILFYRSLKSVLQMPSTIDKWLSGLTVTSDVLYSVKVFTCLSKFPPAADTYITKKKVDDFQCHCSYSYLKSAAFCQFELNRRNFVSCFNKIQDMVCILYSNHVRYEKHQTFITNPEKE